MLPRRSTLMDPDFPVVIHNPSVIGTFVFSDFLDILTHYVMVVNVMFDKKISKYMLKIDKETVRKSRILGVLLDIFSA